MQDDAPVIGNASAIDDATDAAIEQAILERLEYDVWAWALVTVNVTDDVTGKSASACLGGCSYENENDFRLNSGYFDDMVQECIDELSE